MTQAKGRPTDIQQNLYQEKEKERSTCRELSRFELVDRFFEKKSTSAKTIHNSQS